MDNLAYNPRLRVVPVPVEIQGKQMLLFQDPERITDETVLMPIEAAAIVQFLDGTRSVRQIQEELMRISGEIIDSQLIEQLVEELDQHLLLDSPRLQQHVMELNRKWMENKVRPASHAGESYPETAEECKKFLDGFYSAPDGPGGPPSAPKGNSLLAIAAPHMNISDSGACTAHAFKALAENTDASLFVVFGTAHQEPQRLFIPTDKDYSTPLGVCRTDRELLERVQRHRRNRNPLNDYIHKDEHSIEFMILWLQHALAGRDFTALPVLVGGVSPSILAQSPLEAEPEYRDFLTALKAALAETNRKAVFIAGADLAHLGPRYGDQEHFAPIRMAEEEAKDAAMLDPLKRADADGFFLHTAAGHDKRRVCGLGPIHAAVRASAATRGELLKWAYWHDSQTHSVVTFCSMAFF